MGRWICGECAAAIASKLGSYKDFVYGNNPL
jgi:hypothetical protein